MKKILFSLMAILLTVGLVGGGVFAYFFDTETSSGNTFTAGTIDLTFTESVTRSFTLPPGMKPGDTASGTFTVNNIGTLPGSLYATSWYVTADGAVNPVNKSNDAVAKMLLITAFTADGFDMLAGFPSTSQMPDTDGDGRATVYDLVNDTSGVTLPNYPIAPGGHGWFSYDANMLSVGSHVYVLAVQFDPLAGNAYQGDGITWTFEFLLTQQ